MSSLNLFQYGAACSILGGLLEICEKKVSFQDERHELITQIFRNVFQFAGSLITLHAFEAHFFGSKKIESLAHLIATVPAILYFLGIIDKDLEKYAIETAQNLYKYVNTASKIINITGIAFLARACTL